MASKGTTACSALILLLVLGMLGVSIFTLVKVYTLSTVINAPAVTQAPSGKSVTSVGNATATPPAATTGERAEPIWGHSA